MSSPNDHAGRIHKKVFVACNLLFFILCLLSVIARFYIRLRIQKQISIDDGFLLFGTGCLIAAVILFFLYVDIMYMAQAIVLGLPNVEISMNLIEDSLWFHKLVITSLILTWWSLMAVKFCFLFLFKKLVDRIKPMLIYWRVATLFNVIVAFYGTASYIAACPNFTTVSCGQSLLLKTTVKYSVSQMVLDIVGDLMILFIPCRLIWKVKVRAAEKLALVFSLCLTVVVMVCTVARIFGLSYHNTVDATWETFWQYMSASIGLILTSVAAFRSLFVSHRRNHDPQEFLDLEVLQRLYARMKQALRRAFSIQHWGTDLRHLNDSETSKDLEAHAGRDWAKIEHGTITGLRSFVHAYRHTPATVSEVMSSQTRKDDNDYTETWPLPDDAVAGSCSYDDIASHDGHKKTLVPNNDHRYDKIPVSKASPNDYNMLAWEGAETQDKILAINGSEKHEAPILDKPAKVWSGPNRFCDDSVLATDDSSRDTGPRLFQGNAKGKAKPKQ